MIPNYLIRRYSKVNSSRNTAFLWVSILISTALLTMVGGCRTEGDPAFVDFSERLDLERPGDTPQDQAYFKVAIGSMISARETASHYQALLSFIAGKLGRKIQLVQRKTYGEINKLIGLGKIDLAFICSGPYASGREKFGFEALAMPEVRGSYLYSSYLIVNQHSPIQTLADLRGKKFAFTDPESNTGKLVPTVWLVKKGETPESFFGKTIYTYSHDNSIKAVALSLVDGAAVHGHIWEYYNNRDPEFTSKTRIIKKSVPFGNPPVVASSYLSKSMKEKIRMILINMHRDSEGKKILAELMIDRFIVPDNACYNPIIAMQKLSTN